MSKLTEALKRTRKLAADARSLAAFDGHFNPPDWRPFVAELADELATMIETLTASKRRSATKKNYRRRKTHTRRGL